MANNCANLNAIIDEIRADPLSADYHAIIKDGPFSAAKDKNPVKWFIENFPPPNAAQYGQFVGERIWEEQQELFSNWMKTCRDLVDSKMSGVDGEGKPKGDRLLNAFGNVIDNHENWLDNGHVYDLGNFKLYEETAIAGSRRIQRTNLFNDSLQELKKAYYELAKWLVENNCRVKKLTAGDKKNYNTILTGATSWIITALGDRVPSAMEIDPANNNKFKNNDNGIIVRKFFQESLAVVGASMIQLINGSLFNIDDPEILDGDYYKNLNEIYKSYFSGKNGAYSTSNIIQTLNPNGDPTITDFLNDWTGNSYDFERRLLVLAMINYPQWFTLCTDGNSPIKTQAAITSGPIGDYKYFMENAEVKPRFREFGIHTGTNRADVLQCDDISFGVIDAGPNPCPKKVIGSTQKANAVPAGRQNISNLTIELTNAKSVVTGSFNMLSEPAPNPPNPLVSSQVFNIGSPNLTIDTGSLPPKEDKALNTALSAVSAATDVAGVLSRYSSTVNVNVLQGQTYPQNRFQLWLSNGLMLKEVQEAFGKKYAGDWAWRAGAYLKTEQPGPLNKYHDCAFVFDDPDRASIYAAVSMALCAGPEHLRETISYNPSSKKHGNANDVRAICFAPLDPSPVANLNIVGQKIKRLSDEDQSEGFAKDDGTENALVSALAGLTLATDFIHDFQDAKRGGPPLVIVGRAMAGGGIEIGVNVDNDGEPVGPYEPIDYEISEYAIDYVCDQIEANIIYATLPDLSSIDGDSIVYSDDRTEVAPNFTEDDAENYIHIFNETDDFINNQIDAQISLYMRSIRFQMYQEFKNADNDNLNLIEDEIRAKVIGRFEHNGAELRIKIKEILKKTYDKFFAYSVNYNTFKDEFYAEGVAAAYSNTSGSNNEGAAQAAAEFGSNGYNNDGREGVIAAAAEATAYNNDNGSNNGMPLNYKLNDDRGAAVYKTKPIKAPPNINEQEAKLKAFSMIKQLKNATFSKKHRGLSKGTGIKATQGLIFKRPSLGRRPIEGRQRLVSTYGGSKIKKNTIKKKQKNNKNMKKTKKNKKMKKNQKNEKKQKVQKNEKNMKKTKNMKKQKTLKKLKKYKKRSLKK